MFYFQVDNEVGSLSNWISVTELAGGVHACTHCKKRSGSRGKLLTSIEEVICSYLDKQTEHLNTNYLCSSSVRAYKYRF